jgi:hypothetical protein
MTCSALPIRPASLHIRGHQDFAFLSRPAQLSALADDLAIDALTDHRVAAKTTELYPCLPSLSS